MIYFLHISLRISWGITLELTVIQRTHELLDSGLADFSFCQTQADIVMANAMDVGDPSNFARIYDLYDQSHERISALISGATYSDDDIRQTMRQCFDETQYILDPHGACGYQALADGLHNDEIGVFCETAHPAKFKEKVDEIIGIDVEIPERLAAFMRGQKQSVPMTKDFSDFKAYLMEQ